MEKAKKKTQSAVKAEPADKKDAQVRAAQARAEAVKPVRLQMDRKKLQEALVWTEILGEPKCRKRHPRRSRLSDN